MGMTLASRFLRCFLLCPILNGWLGWKPRREHSCGGCSVARWVWCGLCVAGPSAGEPDNVVAERLYVSEGFVPGEIADWGERVATLILSDR